MQVSLNLFFESKFLPRFFFFSVQNPNSSEHIATQETNQGESVYDVTAPANRENNLRQSEKGAFTPSVEWVITLTVL